MPNTFFLDSNFWRSQWEAFWTAPWVFVPLLLVAIAATWWLRSTMHHSEIKGHDSEAKAHDKHIKALEAERDAYKTKVQLVDNKNEDDAREITALRQDLDQIKLLISKGQHSQALASATGAEQRAITIASSNNEIRAIVSEPIGIIAKTTKNRL